MESLLDAHWSVIVFSAFVNMALGFFWFNPQENELARVANESKLNWFRRAGQPYLTLAIFSFSLPVLIEVFLTEFSNFVGGTVLSFVLLMILQAHLLTHQYAGTSNGKKPLTNFFVIAQLSTLIIIAAGLLQ